MKLAFIGLAAAASVVAVASAAIAAKEESPLPPPPPDGTGLPKGQCIRSHDIKNHTVADRNTMLINVNNRATYRVTVSAACLGGAVSSDPIITREPPGRNFICRPIDMDVSVVTGGFDSPCIVRSIVKMTPEEVAALPKKLRP